MGEAGGVAGEKRVEKRSSLSLIEGAGVGVLSGSGISGGMDLRGVDMMGVVR